MKSSKTLMPHIGYMTGIEKTVTEKEELHIDKAIDVIDFDNKNAGYSKMSGLVLQTREAYEHYTLR